MVSKSFNLRNGLIVGAASVDAPTGNITTPGNLSAGAAAFTGAVTAPTATALDNSTKLATTAFVQSTVAQSAAASYTMPGPGSVANQWVKVGTFTAGQFGLRCSLTFSGQSGFNASPDQIGTAVVDFQTSNGNSVDVNGFAAAATVYRTGSGAAFSSTGFKWQSNAAGVTATSYDLYVLLGSFFGYAFYNVKVGANTSWTNAASLASDPGVASSTICIAADQFVLASPIYAVTATFTGNLQVGSTGSLARLAVDGGPLPSGSLGGIGISGQLTTGRSGVFDSGSLSSISSGADSGSIELSVGSSSGYETGISLTGNNATNFKSAIRFLTASTEHMRLSPSGNLLIGTVTDDGTHKLQVNGALKATSADLPEVWLSDGSSKMWVGASFGNNYIESGNSTFTGNAPLNFTGFNSTQGSTANFNFAATNFTGSINGAGTGLTGTAAGLNIGGTATNINNVGTVTLGSATESNSINITAPAFTTDQPVKLLNFDWYGNVWSLGNIRSGDQHSNGFGIYSKGVEKFRFVEGAMSISGNAVIHAGNFNAYSPTQAGGNAYGTWPISITGSAATAASASAAALVTVDNSLVYGRSGLQYVNISGLAGDTANTTNTPTGDWWHIIRGNHGNSTGYYTDLALPMTAATNIRYRRIAGGTSSGWLTVLDSTNYSSYSPTLTGGNASGTWPISVTGAASTVTSSAQPAITSLGTLTSPLRIGDDTGIGYEYTCNNPAAFQYYKIATLPVSTDSTKDHLIIKGVLNSNWVAVNSTPFEVLLGNRSGFSYKYHLDGDAFSQARIVTYLEADGSVSVYLFFLNGSFCTASFSVSGFGCTIYQNPALTTSATGTNNFDTSNIALYPPQRYFSGATTVIPGAISTGALTATTVNGAGTGLTGTAAGLNIGGSAGSLAGKSLPMYYQGFTLDANAMDSNSTGFTYGVNAPHVGPIARVSAGGRYDMWLNAAYGAGGNRFAFRTANGDSTTLNPWREVLHDANYNSYSPTLTGGNASGTWGINVIGTSNSISGYNNPTTAATANTIAYRDGNGDLAVRELVMTSAVHDADTPTGIMGIYAGTNQVVKYSAARTAAFISGQAMNIAGSASSLNNGHSIAQIGSTGSWNADFQNTPPGTMRHGGDVAANGVNGPGGSWWMQQNLRHTNGSNYWGTQVAWGWEDNANKLLTRNVSGGAYGGWVSYLNSTNYSSYSPTLTGGNASGTWPISITGVANAVAGLQLNSSTAPVDPNNVSYNQIGYCNTVNLFGQGDGGLHSSAYNNSFIHQIYGDFRSGQMAARGKNNGTWQSWRSVLDSGNYNSYSPTLTGGNASGTWGINVNGTAQYASMLTNGGGYGIYSTTVGTSYSQAVCMREYAGAGNTGTGMDRAPRLGFHWGGIVASSIAMETNGRIGIWNNPGTSNENFIANTIYATGDVIAYASDRRLKTDVRSITGAVKKVKALNGVIYKWNDLAGTHGFDQTKDMIGVLAQEVEAVLPEIIKLAPFDDDGLGNSKSGENYKTVQYDKIVPLLIEAIKEQQVTIDTQNGRITRLENLIEQLLNKQGN